MLSLSLKEDSGIKLEIRDNGPGMDKESWERPAGSFGVKLVKVLSKQLRGACLDVFENEKPSTYTPGEREMYERLFSLPGVLVSPHIAGWTKESKYKLAKILLDKILTHYASPLSR